MSDFERFAQFAHQKWATMSESLRSLTKNERMSESLVFLSTSDSLRKSMSEFPALLFLDSQSEVNPLGRNPYQWGTMQMFNNIHFIFIINI